MAARNLFATFGSYIENQQSLLARSATMGLATVALLVINVAASAEIMTYNISFVAEDFIVGSGPDPAPVDPVVGSFLVTLDPTLTYNHETTGISLNSLNIDLGSTPSFSYDPTLNNGQLSIGGVNGGSDFIFFSPSTNDFWLFLYNFATTPTFTELGYSQTSVSSNNLFYTENGNGTVDFHPTPEPSSIILFALGSVIAGAFGLRRNYIR